MKKIFIITLPLLAVACNATELSQEDLQRIEFICESMKELDGYKFPKKSIRYLKSAGITTLPQKKHECINYMTDVIERNYDNRESFLKKTRNAVRVATASKARKKAYKNLNP